MKKLSIFSLIGLTMLFVARCQDDLLESTPYGQATSADFWRNGDDAMAAANAMYEVLRDHDFYGHAEHTFDIPSDDQWRAGDHGEDQAIEEFTFDPDNAQLAFSWRPKYEIISRANAVLMNVPDIEMDQTLKERTLGEAHFMRGFTYWRLAVIYGGVPLILEEDVRENNYNKPRASLEETYGQIESDWLRAADLLPPTHDEANLGRPTQGTVWGFLTKLYMYQEDFANALEVGTRVINGPNELAPSFGDNFAIATENNPEMLFAVQALDGWAGTAHRIYTTPRPWGGWDFHEPVLIGKDILVHEVVENVVGRVVVDAKRLLLNEGVVGHGVDLQTGRECEGSQRAMGRERHVIGLRHGRDLAAFGDTARMAQVRLDNVDIALRQHALEVPAGIEPLPQGDGRGHMGRDLTQGLGVFAQHRLFDEHQAVGLKLFGEHLSHGLLHAPVEIHADAQVIAHRVTDRGDGGHGGVDLGVGVDDLHLFAAIELDGLEASRHHVLGVGGHIRGAIPADPGIDLDLVAALAAQHGVHRQARRLARDIP